MKKRYFAVNYMFISAAIFFSLAFASAAHAAQMSVVVSNGTISQNNILQVNVVLDTQGEDANAVQAEITYPAGLFKLGQINDGGSAVSYWVSPPVGSTPGEIDFAGIMPGGFAGSNGEICSFTLVPLTMGTGTIEIATSSVLANDGNGTPLPLTITNAPVIVNPSVGSSTPAAPVNDYTPPNPFTPQVVSDPNIFGGKYFLVFNTADSQSGIDHYEVLEVPSGNSEQPFSSWHIATSPYLLTDQSLSSDIYVRAVDHAGNFIVVELPARHSGSRKNIVDAIGILLAIIVLLLLLWIWRRRRHA